MVVVVVWAVFGVLALFFPGVVAVLVEDWKKRRKIDLHFAIAVLLILLIIGWAINIAISY